MTVSQHTIFATACAMDLLLGATRKAASTCETPDLDMREGEKPSLLNMLPRSSHSAIDAVP